MATKKIKNQEIAYAFLDQKEFRKNILYCLDWDTFFKYKDGYYEMYEPEAFRELIWRFIVAKYSDLPVLASLVKDVVQQIKWGAYRKIKEINTPYLAFEDKLYDIEKFEWMDFDREKIALHKIKFKSEDINMPIEKFENFLRTTLVNESDETDEELISVVQEMFGYYMMNNLKAQKVFFLVGDGANGKSVMAKIIEAMIGSKYVSAMSIQHLTLNQFATSGLIGKKINICNEEESKYLRSDRFKALVSGDVIQAERKHENQFVFRPSTKYIFASNRMPSFEGLNYGIRRRITIIPFKRIFREHEQNKNLADELMSELPGIINWAIEGAKRLVSNNYKFSDTKATDETKEDFENTVSSPVMFFRENFEANKDGFVNNMVMYKEYRTWCEENGKKPMSSVGFHRDISQNLHIKMLLRYEDGKAERGKLASRKKDVMPEDLKRIEKLISDDSTTTNIERTMPWDEN